MSHRHGWCARGERLKVGVPRGYWKATTLLGALTLLGFIAPFVLDGPVNGKAFLVYVEQVLCPELRPADIIIMDNRSSNKAQGVSNSSEQQVLNSITFRPSVLTSTPSRMLSQSSKRSCAKRHSEQSEASGPPLVTCCQPSGLMNAETTLQPQVAMLAVGIPL